MPKSSFMLVIAPGDEKHAAWMREVLLASDFDALTAYRYESFGSTPELSAERGLVVISATSEATPFSAECLLMVRRRLFVPVTFDGTTAPADDFLPDTLIDLSVYNNDIVMRKAGFLRRVHVLAGL